MFHRVGLFSPLQRSFHFLRCHQVVSKRGPIPKLRTQLPNARTIFTAPARFNPSKPVSSKGVILTGCVGLGLTLYLKRTPIHCDTHREKAAGGTSPKPAQTPTDIPQSEVNYYELSFGTIAGVCAGIFVKKGAKFAATILGGIFVLLQYFHSLSFLRIDWSRIGKGFNNAIRIEDEDGTSHPPTILSVWSWLVDFLTADFQPRASFIAGFLLGFRLG